MKLIATITYLLFSTACFSQNTSIEKTWYNAEKTSKIQIFKASNGKYYGKILWMKDPLDASGQPATDKENPDKSKQNNPLLGMLILSGFEKDASTGQWTDGKVYDPINGKTYCGKLTLKDNKLDLRGFICSFSLLGRSSEWTLAE
jgi:uncharacterized protein (DUF2147 family)